MHFEVILAPLSAIYHAAEVKAMLDSSRFWKTRAIGERERERERELGPCGFLP
jgi:hypothetical protein